jgi:hypothetical protein
MSDYQAIYDAVRSRISGGDIGEVVEAVARDAFDISHAKIALDCAFDMMHSAAAEHARPSAVYRPSIGPDGNQWCALYGANLQEGVCAFGDTPEKAMQAFDAAWVSERCASQATGGQEP